MSFLYTLFIFLRFKYYQDIDKKLVTKGDKVNFIFTISNEGLFLYPYVRVTFHGTKTIFNNQFQVKSFSVPPFKSKSFSVELQCKYRGNYEIGAESVEFEDFLGIFKLKYKVRTKKYITVYPHIVYLDNFQLKTDFLSESHSILNNKQEDMSTIADVRNYYPGDSLRRIHWKLTAKSRTMMVKKFQSTSETSVVIMLDLRRNPYTTEQNIILEDKLIESIVSVMHYCLYNWIPVKLVYFNDGIKSIVAKNYLMFNEIYEILAKVKFIETIPVKDLIEVYTNDIPAKTNILVFTSNLDYDLYNQIYKTSVSGYDVSLIYTSAEKILDSCDVEAESILDFLPEIGVNTYKIGIDDDIKVLFEQGGYASA
jgi:Uncharacterized conserved protein (some members contain a von Willebrand factor type A (vWA) domain)